MTRLGLVLVAIGSVACTRASSGNAVERLRAQSDAGAVGLDASAGRTDQAPAAAEWSGSYHSEVGTVYVPPEWKSVHWSAAGAEAGPGSQDGVGDGSMHLKVSGTRVSGVLDGPLGPAIVDGVAAGAAMTATVLRRDPADRGFSGTLIAQVDGGSARGTMNLSLAQAGAVRTATFALEKAAPAPR